MLKQRSKPFVIGLVCGGVIEFFIYLIIGKAPRSFIAEILWSYWWILLLAIAIIAAIKSRFLAIGVIVGFLLTLLFLGFFVAGGLG